MEGATVVPKSQVVVPEDDELDEDETVDIVMRENLDSAAWKGRTWAELFRNFVGADWDEECVDQERPLGIRFFGGGPSCLLEFTQLRIELVRSRRRRRTLLRLARVASRSEYPGLLTCSVPRLAKHFARASRLKLSGVARISFTALLFGV